MLTTIEAEIDVNGSVTFLEPLTISKKSRAIITLLDVPMPKKRDMRQPQAKPEDGDAKNRQLDWLKAHRDEYAGQYVALDGDVLLAHAATLKEIRAQIKQRDEKSIFIVKVFAEETILAAGLLSPNLRRHPVHLLRQTRL